MALNGNCFYWHNFGITNSYGIITTYEPELLFNYYGITVAHNCLNKRGTYDRFHVFFLWCHCYGLFHGCNCILMRMADAGVATTVFSRLSWCHHGFSARVVAVSLWLSLG